MAIQQDEVTFSHGLNVGVGYPYFYGLGPLKVRGSTYMEGPTYVGMPFAFPYPAATTMLTRDFNMDSPITFSPLFPQFNPYAVSVVGNLNVWNHMASAIGVWAGINVWAGVNVWAGLKISTPGLIIGGIVMDYGGNILARKKDRPFDMEHPTKPGWRLRHVCLEGPEIGVYKHGKASGNVFEMPDYWTGLVKEETITVQLTPIGSSRNIFVEEVKDNKVYVGGDNIGEYYYLLHASRYDDDLIVEYKGKSHLDYPNGNEGYEFSFENDNMERIVKEVINERLNQLSSTEI